MSIMQGTATIVICSLALCRPGLALDCSSMLKDGMYNTTTTVYSDKRAKQVQQFICSSNATTLQSAQSESTSAGLGVDIFSFNFGNTTSQANFAQWKSSFCASNLSQESSDTSFQQAIKTVSDSLAKTFMQCLNYPGLIAYVEQQSPTSITLHAKMNPYMSITTAKIRGIQITPKVVSDSCQLLGAFGPGQTLAGTDLTTTCIADSNSETIITLQTDAGSASFVVPRSLPTPATSPIVDNAKACLALDKDACKKRALEIKRTCDVTDRKCLIQVQCWNDQAIAIDYNTKVMDCAALRLGAQ